MCAVYGADRQNTHTISVDNGSSSATATLSYTYDDLGRLWKITRPLTESSVKDVTYEYNLHGWLKKITTNHFTESLLYTNGLGTPCYNGNISTIKWKDIKSSKTRGYKLTYDDAGRLVQGVYGEGSALTSNVGRFSESVQYDANGNITSITRYGKNSSGGYSLMDDLTLSYSGNRLTGVTETVTDNSTNGSFEYKKANGSQYIYDNNGSLKADKSRGIAYITYDANSNPSCIYFTNGNETKYVYSATGRKLRTVYYTAKPNITRTFGVQPAELTQSQILYSDSIDYLLGGSLLLKNGQTDKYLFDGGYARLNSSTGNFLFFYYNKDHLGNNHEVLNHKGGVRQVTSYYPFGAPYADDDAISGTDIQPYKYNGKELDLMHGLNTYDYSARQYYSILGRWDRVDPLCERYYSTSPYAYCSNNPIRFVDPTGMQREEPEKQRDANGFEANKNSHLKYTPRSEKPLESIHPEFYLLPVLRMGGGTLSMVSTASKKLIPGFNHVKGKVSDTFSSIWNSIITNEKINTFDDLLQNSSKVRQTKGHTTIYRKEGNGLEDFNSMHLDKVESFETGFGKGFRGFDKNKIEYKYRPGSSSGEPTIEMIKNNRTKIKLRYDHK